MRKYKCFTHKMYDLPSVHARGLQCLCVSMSVTMLAACVPYLYYVDNKVPLSYFWQFQVLIFFSSLYCMWKTVLYALSVVTAEAVHALCHHMHVPSLLI